MRTFLTISVGAAPRDAKPILASDDRKVILAALDALLERAGVMTRRDDAKNEDRGRDE